MHACKTEEESQRHMLNCPALADHSVLPNNVPEYDDLMGQDLQKVEAIGRILRAKFNVNKSYFMSKLYLSYSITDFISSFELVSLSLQDTLLQILSQ